MEVVCVCRLMIWVRCDIYMLAMHYRKRDFFFLAKYTYLQPEVNYVSRQMIRAFVYLRHGAEV